MSKLLNCPFCGKTHALTVDNLAGDDWYVECGACKVQQHAIYPTCDAAIAAWDRRAGGPSEATDEMIDAACAAVPGLYRVDAMRAIEAALCVGRL